MKEIRLQLIKTSSGYSIADKTNNTISFFEDDDIGRKAMVNFLIEELLNKEVENGRKYR